MSKMHDRSKIVIPTQEEDAVISRAAKDDPDAQPLTAKQLKAMVPLKSLRGRPKAHGTKKLVSIRYSPEVLEYFKSTGEGWQTLMDRVLCEYVTQHSPKS